MKMRAFGFEEIDCRNGIFIFVSCAILTISRLYIGGYFPNNSLAMSITNELARFLAIYYFYRNLNIVFITGLIFSFIEFIFALTISIILARPDYATNFGNEMVWAFLTTFNYLLLSVLAALIYKKASLEGAPLIYCLFIMIPIEFSFSEASRQIYEHKLGIVTEYAVRCSIMILFFLIIIRMIFILRHRLKGEIFTNRVNVDRDV